MKFGTETLKKIFNKHPNALTRFDRIKVRVLTSIFTYDPADIIAYRGINMNRFLAVRRQHLPIFGKVRYVGKTLDTKYYLLGIHFTREHHRRVTELASKVFPIPAKLTEKEESMVIHILIDMILTESRLTTFHAHVSPLAELTQARDSFREFIAMAKEVHPALHEVAKIYVLECQDL